MTNCKIFNVLKPGKECTGEIYKMKFHFNCSSISVVYLIRCKVCKKQYTG